MVNQELRNYIARCRQLGQSADQIRKTLLDNHWNASDVDAALAENPSAGVPQPISLQLVSYEKNFFSLVTLTLGLAIPLIFAESLSFYLRTLYYINPIVKLGMALVVLAAIFFALWLGLSLVFYVTNVSSGVSAAIHNALRRIHSYLWIAILIDLIVQFGNLFLLVPGIIFAVWFSFSTFVLAQEDSRGLNAMLKSKEYVRGKWWRVFGTLLGLGVIAVSIILATAVIARFSHGVLGPILAVTGMVLLLIVYYPFALVTFYNLFAKIKNEKGIVPISADGRVFFTTIAILSTVGFVIILLLAVILGGSHRSVEHSKYTNSQPYVWSGQQNQQGGVFPFSSMPVVQ